MKDTNTAAPIRWLLAGNRLLAHIPEQLLALLAVWPSPRCSGVQARPRSKVSH